MTRLLILLLCAGLSLLGACGNEGGKPPAVAVSVSAVPPAAPNSAAPIGGYEATLAQGIQYAERPGYPRFIRSVSGMSGHEPNGRWSEGPTVVYEFVDPLPKEFVLRLEMGGAFGPNVGKPVKVKVKDWQGEFTVETSLKTIELRVKTTEPASVIEFTIPEPKSPKELGGGDDPRRVGILFRRLSIVST